MSVVKIRAGADAVAALLPHRPPLLLVDRIDSFEPGERPVLRAARAISVHEPVFEGHFPGMMLWPGVYTIEGMGQTCQLLLLWLAIQDGFQRVGLSADEVVTAVRGLDARARMRGTPDGPAVEALRASLGAPQDRLGVSAAVDVRFFEPVFAGDLLEYEVRLTHARDNARRFDVQATVERRSVARGTMTGVILRAPHTP